MNASARIETEAEAGSSVTVHSNFSLDVNERLVTNYDDASKRPTAPAAAAPDRQSVPTPRRRPFLTPLPRRQKSPCAGVPDQTAGVTPFSASDSNVTSRGGHVTLSRGTSGTVAAHWQAPSRHCQWQSAELSLHLWPTQIPGQQAWGPGHRDPAGVGQHNKLLLSESSTCQWSLIFPSPSPPLMRQGLHVADSSDFLSSNSDKSRDSGDSGRLTWTRATGTVSRSSVALFQVRSPHSPWLAGCCVPVTVAWGRCLPSPSGKLKTVTSRAPGTACIRATLPALHHDLEAQAQWQAATGSVVTVTVADI